MAKRTSKAVNSVDFDEEVVVEEKVTPVHRTIIQTIDPGIAKRVDDQERIKQLNAQFRGKIAKERKVSYKPPKYYADILGKVYAYTFNNIDVVIRFDGTEQKFPETVYNHMMKKLARILDSSTPVNEIDEL